MKLKLCSCRFLPATLITSAIILVGLESVDSFTTAARRLEFDSEHSEEIPVYVELVNRKRVRRHISSLSTTPDFEYHLKISSDADHDHSDPSLSYDLKLQPLPHSVFSSAFKYTEFDEDDAGNPVTRSFVPSREELDLIESRLYTDKDTNSFVRLEQDDEGDIELFGVVDRARIRTRRDTGTRKNSFSMKHSTRVESIDVTPPDLTLADMHDELEIPDNFVLPSRRSGGPVDLNAWINLEPELALLFDYQMTQDIGGDWNRKLEYAAITINGVNGYYEITNDSIRIKCELVHVMEMKSEAQQTHLDKLKGTRYDMGGGKWRMEYDPIEVATAYEEWVYEHAKEIGAHDMAAMLMGIKFTGTSVGVASTPGACLFNFANERASLACPISLDYGANFEGIPYLAHEIGHNLGSPHDGAAAKKGRVLNKRSLEACPFGHGNLMGYYRHNYTKAFRFSKCSLDAIKDYVTMDIAACLRPEHKTGRPIIHTSVREGGNAEVNPYSRNMACSRRPELNFQGVVSYQTADEDCRAVKCEAKSGETEKFSSTSLVPARNTPCGDNHLKGKCRNGFCIGQGPAVDMDSVCKIATRHADSQFYPGTRPLDQICSSEGWSCSDAGDKVRTFKDVIVVPGTPCGGTKICFNKECVEKDQITNPNKECILQTGKQEAKQVQFKHSNPKCAGLVKCTFGTEFELIGAASTDPDCNPAAASPVSLVSRGADPEDHEHPKSLNEGDDHQPNDEEGETSTLKKAKTLQEVCDDWTKWPGSKIKNRVKSDKRDHLCSKLICIKDPYGPDHSDVNEGVTPNGTICGPLRRCQSGKCVECNMELIE